MLFYPLVLFTLPNLNFFLISIKVSGISVLWTSQGNIQWTKRCNSIVSDTYVYVLAYKPNNLTNVSILKWTAAEKPYKSD